jgi:hypothetical protein
MRARRRSILALPAGLAVLLALPGIGCRETPRKQVAIVDGVEVVSNPAGPLHKNPGRVTRSFSRDFPSLPYVVPPKAKAIYAQAGVPTPDHSDDVLELFLPDANLWVRTSTVDAKKGLLFDVFSAEGDFLDSFFILVKGKIIGIRGGTIFASEEAEDGTTAFVLYENLEAGRD